MMYQCYKQVNRPTFSRNNIHHETSHYGHFLATSELAHMNTLTDHNDRGEMAPPPPREERPESWLRAVRRRDRARRGDPRRNRGVEPRRRAIPRPKQPRQAALAETWSRRQRNAGRRRDTGRACSASRPCSDARASSPPRPAHKAERAIQAEL